MMRKRYSMASKKNLLFTLALMLCQTGCSAGHQDLSEKNSGVRSKTTEGAESQDGAAGAPDPLLGSSSANSMTTPVLPATVAADTKDAASAPPSDSSCSGRPEHACTAGEALGQQIANEIRRATDTCARDRCGSFAVDIDERGCGVRMLLEDTVLDDDFSQCVLRELKSSRFSCAARTRQGSKTSCTLL
jgi:hypothetical protein